MKLAIAGKGGSGKTSISGTLARLIARDGHSVLAIDGDTNPNLALTLGISADRINDLPVLPSGLLERGEEGFELKKSLAELRSTHSVEGPDGVTLLVMAHPHEEDAGSGCYCGMHATVRELIESATDADADVTVLDTEASPEHLAEIEARLDAGPPVQFPTKKARALLAYLAISRGRAHSRDDIAKLAGISSADAQRAAALYRK